MATRLRPMPRLNPAAASVAPLSNTRARISCLRAPRAIRMPISRVRPPDRVGHHAVDAGGAEHEHEPDRRY